MFEFSSTIQWRIQDFQDGEGAHQPLSLGENLLFDKVFAENCMKMKETGPGGGGVLDPKPPLDPPIQRGMVLIFKVFPTYRESFYHLCSWKNNVLK